jgi:hypothetical protein
VTDAENRFNIADAAVVEQHGNNTVMLFGVSTFVVIFGLKLFGTTFTLKILFVIIIISMADLIPFLTTRELEQWGQMSMIVI